MRFVIALTPRFGAGTAAANRAETVARCALALVAALHLLLLLEPWRFAVPAAGLDASWIQVVAYAAASGWQWGRDIAFTYGPLGYLRAPIFHDGLLVPTLLWNGLLAATVVAGVIGLLRRVPTAGAIVLYVIVAIALTTRTGKGAYLMLPLITLLLHFRSPATGAPVSMVLAAVGMAVYGIGYTSLLVSGLVTSTLVDVSRVLRRRPPLLVPLFAAVVIAASGLAGQSLASLPTFLRSVYEFITGYADAMSTPGSAHEIVAFLGISAVALVLVLACERQRLTDPRRRADAMLLVTSLGAFWFIAWKSGFVRHDLHSVFSWRALAMGLAGYAAIRWQDASRPLRGAMIGTALACLLLATIAGGNVFGIARVAALPKDTFIDFPARALRGGAHAALDPAGWIGDLRRTRDEAHAAIRASYPDLAADGSVDLIGNDQAALLAHNLDYRPQPVFQALAAYSPWLVRLNREHLRSDRAATTLFVTSSTIDNRYPLSEAGTAIVDVLSHYRPYSLAGEYVRFVRRPPGVAIGLDDAGGVESVLGEWTPVPGGSDPVLLQASVRPNLLGRLAGIAWRVPPLSISVRLADGRERAHRLVAATATEGLLLSPYPDSAAVVAAQVLGRLAIADANRVTAVRIDTGSEADRALFRNAVAIRFARVTNSAVGDASASESLLRLLDRRETVIRLAQSAPAGNPGLEVREALLFAHAPATLGVAATGATAVSLRFGIFDGAWSGDRRTDGVCFRVRSIDRDGQSTLLHERCLHPSERAEDRGEHEARIALPSPGAAKLVLETACGTSCAWDWSYWKNIDIAR